MAKAMARVRERWIEARALASWAEALGKQGKMDYKDVARYHQKRDQARKAYEAAAKKDGYNPAPADARNVEDSETLIIKDREEE